MDKTILITRPKGDEYGLAEMLQVRNYRAIHEPLMDILLRHNERYALHRALMDDPDAILVTSRHAVQALSILTEIRDLFLICVGEATAKAAFSAGFTRVSTAGGNAKLMIEQVLASYDEDSRFIYASGEDVRTDLAAELGAAGMRVERIVVYETIAAQQLSDTLVEQLKRGQVDGVTFLSQRTAEIFMKLIDRHGISNCIEGLRAFCMSETVADSLALRPWMAIHVAHEPTLASLTNSIDNVFLANG
jgi:uroporphyrinogen-III synthase